MGPGRARGKKVKLAISNLAWDREHEVAVATIMRGANVSGVELAATKIWSDPLAATDQEITGYRKFWNSFDIEIVSLQSLLFGKPESELFGGDAARAEMLDYLRAMIRLASKLGARVLVFGSPRNRRRDGLSDDAAEAIAIPFFRSLANEAAQHRVTFCFEPNPVEYGCDWITTSSEGARLVEAVGTEGFALNLDAGGMTLAGEEPASAIASCSQVLAHFHISNPNLTPVGKADDLARHVIFGRALKRAAFSGWTSIEMLPATNTIEAIDTALRQSAQQYR